MEIDLELAKRVRAIRRRKSISQEELSVQSGVSYGSIKRFETTGIISLVALTKLATELGIEECVRDKIYRFL